MSSSILRIHEKAKALRGRPASVIYNAPNLPEFPPRRERNGPTTIGFIGRLEEPKGIDIILALLASPRLSEFDFLVAGVGTRGNTRRVADALQRRGRGRAVGTVNPAGFYQEIDLLLVPTQWHEPYGRVAAEGRLAGIPVIASQVGGLPEVLAGYQGANLVKDYSKVDAWIDAICAMVERGMPQQLGASGIEPPPPPEQGYETIFRSLTEGPERRS